MIEQFREQFREALKEFRVEIAENPTLLSLLDPFYGMLDANVYQNWKNAFDMRYVEVGNLIKAMGAREDTDVLNELAVDFIGEGYDCAASRDFDEGRVQSQLNLIEAITEGKMETLIQVMKSGENDNNGAEREEP